MAKYYTPTADEIRNARIDTKLTQSDAADLCLTQANTWARYEQGKTKMLPCMWELFIMKVAEISVKGHTKPVARDIDAENQALVDIMSDWRSAEDIAQDAAYEQWCKERDERIAKLKGDQNADN